MDEVVSVFERYAIWEGSVLDVGCGTGLLATALGDSFTYTGIDISENMLKKAKERGYNVRQGDALTLLKNEKSGSFDHVVCIGALYWMPNAIDAWKEMVRVARKTVIATFDIVSPI
jgi:ubiquinone/menaquinone biosynthesis C-methylase UbiE